MLVEPETSSWPMLSAKYHVMDYTLLRGVILLSLHLSQQIPLIPRPHGVYIYTHRLINLYRMFFADFSVNSQRILMKFCKDYFRVTRRLP